MAENTEYLALWGGRFTSGPSPELARLSKSTQFDWRLADDDIAGSRAHARALGRAGLLTADELSRMEASLDELQRRVDSGAFAPIEDDEDEATALERGLLEIAGDELGGKLRAGRSRNDQIACLIRMWLRRHSRVIAGQLLSLASALIDQSVKAGGTVMPGRTHMQHAQPVLLAHQLMAHVWPLLRDVQRLVDWDKRIDASPYGSGALAGNTLGLEPVAVARELGFGKVTENSIDGTASRDLVAEFAFVAAMAGVDISRLSEEIIIWNTQEFAFVRLDDAYSTGSSIMPQKKNPDIAELARGKSGRLIGDLTGLLATLKGLPTAYARDLQEDKEAVFDQVDTLEVLLPAFTGMIATMSFDHDRLQPKRRPDSRSPRTSPNGSSRMVCRSATRTSFPVHASSSPKAAARSCGISRMTISSGSSVTSCLPTRPRRCVRCCPPKAPCPPATARAARRRPVYVSRSPAPRPPSTRCACSPTP